MEDCEKSGYAVYADSKLYKFDEAGNTRAKELLKTTKSKKGLHVKVVGTIEGETITVESISEVTGLIARIVQNKEGRRSAFRPVTFLPTRTASGFVSAFPHDLARDTVIVLPASPGERRPATSPFSSPKHWWTRSWESGRRRTFLQQILCRQSTRRWH